MAVEPTEEPKLERKLAAILAADIAGYSALMGVDDARTVRDLKAHQSVILPMIGQFRGRVIDTAGDGILAEFSSAVNAVECAIAIQQSMTVRNAEVDPRRQMLFRIGVNLGDVVYDEHRIYGDGINIAARLESIAEPGTIYLSDKVHDEVRGKVATPCKDLGLKSLKNISRPVRVYRLETGQLSQPEEVARRGLSLALLTSLTSGKRRISVALFVVIALGLGCSAWWLVTQHRIAEPKSHSALSRSPARASIAILPLASLAQDEAADYFSDSLTEDIISALGRFRDLSVSSRNAVFGYKGKNPLPEQVGRDLEVRYVVEGSIRRTPKNVRVLLNLTDTSRGIVLWTDKFEAQFKELFELQDQITTRLTGAIAAQVTRLETSAIKLKPPANLEAYDLVLQGRDKLRQLTRSNNAAARVAFERAIELDPSYSPAYVGLARVNRYSVIQGWAQNPVQVLERAETLARKAISLDNQNAGAHAILGSILLQFKDYDGALNELKQAIEINSNDSDAYSALIPVLLWRGDTQEAISAGELLLAFEPALPAPDAFHLATAYVLANRGPDAIRILQQSINRNRDEPNTNIILAAAYVISGRDAEARQQAAIIRSKYPWFAVEEFGALLRNVSQREKLREVIKQAGL